MKDFLKKNWLNLFGTCFFLLSFIYMIIYAIESNLLSNSIKINISIAFGVLLAFTSIIFHKRFHSKTAEIVFALSGSIVYLSCFIAGVYYEIWGFSLFLGTISILTIIMLLLSFHQNLRIASNLSLVVFVISPLLFDIPASKIIYLSLYLSLTAIIAFILSQKKNWPELRAISFIGSWLIFYSYAVLDIGTIEKNYFLISSILIYLVFMSGFLFVFSTGSKIQIMDFVLSIYNGFLFAKHLPHFSDEWSTKFFILLAVGLVFILSGILINYIFEALRKYFIITLITGIFFVLSASLFIPIPKEFTSLFITFEWLFAIISLMFISKTFCFSELKIPIIILWISTNLFWYITSYSTPTVIWFWGFVTFLNWSNLAWLLLAGIGFLVTSNGKYSLIDKDQNKNLFKFVKILSHIVVCIFLAFQVDNLWQQFGIANLEKDIFITLVWTIYSLILFAKGLYSKQEIYRNFSLFVLIVSSLKAFFIDIFDANSFYKMIFLFVFGLITIAMSMLNKKWNSTASP